MAGSRRGDTASRPSSGAAPIVEHASDRSSYAKRSLNLDLEIESPGPSCLGEPGAAALADGHRAGHAQVGRDRDDRVLVRCCAWLDNGVLGVERGASVTEAGHAAGSGQPEPVHGPCAQMTARGSVKIGGSILALVPGRLAQLGAAVSDVGPPNASTAPRRAVSPVRLLRVPSHSSWRRRDTPFEQDRNRNSLTGGDTLVNIVPSDHPRDRSSYQAGLAVTDGEHLPGAGPVRWPQIAESALLAHLMPGVASSAQIDHSGVTLGLTSALSGVASLGSAAGRGCCWCWRRSGRCR